MADAADIFKAAGQAKAQGAPGPAVDSSTPQQANNIDDFIGRRQQAKFGRMADEVKDMLGRFPLTTKPALEDFIAERQRLRRGGYDQAEEDAIMNTFATTQGRRSSELEGALRFKPSYKEGEIVDPGKAFSIQEPVVSPDSSENRSNQIMDLLTKFHVLSGRERLHGTPNEYMGFDI